MSKIKISRKGIELAFIDVQNYSRVQGFNKFFDFFVIRNVSHLLTEVQAMDELKKKSIPPARITEFETKRNELVEKYCDKDSEGKSISTVQDLGNGKSQSVFTFKNTMQEFTTEFDALKAEYQADADAYDTSLKELDTLMNEEIEIDIAKISFKHIPDNVVIKNILLFINETSEEIDKMLLG